jgi:pimeloyl-ACP methyl ester carboxylesterase
MPRCLVGAFALLVAWLSTHAAAPDSEEPLPEAWDYAPAMRKVAAKFRGTEGVVLHLGGSMTIANPYGTWARSGKGKTREDSAILTWMHTDAKDKTDGWWLCRTELEHYRAYTAESGLKSAMLLDGGKRGLPTLEKMLDEYRPRMVTIECGIYDVEDGVALEVYRKNMGKVLDLILDRGAIPVLNTIPPFKAQLERTRQFNAALRELARERGCPVLDLEREVLTRRPDDWFGTLMDRIHLTAAQTGGNPGAEPTAENLRKSGYLLRGYLTVRKVAEIKCRVLDERPPEAPAVPPKTTFKVEGHAAFVILPRKVADKAPVPWVWYAPTFPNLPEARENWMFEKFLAAGIAIAGVDVGESYGSPKGRAVYSALYKELVTNRNFAPKATLLARSRGGLMLYSWACENPEAVACIAGIYPVCDLRSYPGLDKACGAYGLTRAELEEQLDKHNPIARLAPLAKAGVPIFHIHGDVDTVVPLKENSGEMARQYEKLGGKMELKIAKGQGHNLWEGFFQCQELVDFVLAHAAPAGR